MSRFAKRITNPNEIAIEVKQRAGVRVSKIIGLKSKHVGDEVKMIEAGHVHGRTPVH